MGNRKQPFGYRVVMGEIALHPQESKLVEYIFQQYLAGATYNTLVTSAPLALPPVYFDLHDEICDYKKCPGQHPGLRTTHVH